MQPELELQIASIAHLAAVANELNKLIAARPTLANSLALSEVISAIEAEVLNASIAAGGIVAALATPAAPATPALPPQTATLTVVGKLN